MVEKGNGFNCFIESLPPDVAVKAISHKVATCLHTSPH